MMLFEEIILIKIKNLKIISDTKLCSALGESSLLHDVSRSGANSSQISEWCYASVVIFYGQSICYLRFFPSLDKKIK